METHSTTSRVHSPVKTAEVVRTSFAELLDRYGVCIRGRRADCVHCEAVRHGCGRATVSFTDEVAYCHRCKWTANKRTLSRALGVPCKAEDREQRERRDCAARFLKWRNAYQQALLVRWRHAARRAELARDVLTRFPECEPAMAALADFYHNQAYFLGALDLLAFEKLSPWLERPMTREHLAAAFAEVEANSHAEVANAS